MELTDGFVLDAAQLEAMARGLYAVATGDGLDASEAELIRRFVYAAGGSDEILVRVQQLPRIEAEQLAAALPEPELRRLFLKAAMVLARADGRVSQRENRAILEYVLALGINLGMVEQLEREADAWIRSDKSSRS